LVSGIDSDFDSEDFAPIVNANMIEIYNLSIRSNLNDSAQTSHETSKIFDENTENLIFESQVTEDRIKIAEIVDKYESVKHKFKKYQRFSQKR